MRKSVAVVGASGYSGGELVRILLGHSEFSLDAVFANSAKGQKLSFVHPQFNGNQIEFKDVADLGINDFDLVFLALPAGVSGMLLKDRELNKKYVDLGADFRLIDKEDWFKFYPGKYSGAWTYGLPEASNQKSAITKSDKVANPGCYATAASLGLLPAVKAGALSDDFVNIVAASGTTGAGKSLKANLLNSEANNNLSPYKVGGIHQHIPEIEQTLGIESTDPIKISFLPILAPMPRGILLTASFKSDLPEDEIRDLYASYYKGSKFIQLLEKDGLPNTRSLIGSNNAHISVVKDARNNLVQTIVAIDNLGKGAAGQAIQNANLMFNFEEDHGLAKYGIGS